MDQELLLALLLGIGLSAASGFRVFVPLLLAGIATLAGWYAPSASMAWIGSTPALIVFGVATAVEIAAYYVPWVDNVLDHLGYPLALLAGTLLTASSIGDEVSPMLTWVLAVFIGGGTASLLHWGTTALRFVSTTVTGGCANILLATLEWFFALVVAVLAIFAPVLAVVLVVALIVIGIRAIRRRRPHPTPS